MIDWQYNVPYGGHRPITLIFATERSAAGIQEALQAGRTTVWFNNTLIGKEEFLVPLIRASLTVTEAAYQGDTQVLSVLIENTSDVAFIVDNQTDYTFHGASDVLIIAPHQTTRLDVKTLEKKSSLTLVFDVLNAVTAPGTHPEVTLEIQVD